MKVQSLYLTFFALVFLFHSLIFIDGISGQQNTWIKTLEYDYGAFSSNHHDSLSVGPYEFASRSDGKFYILCNDHQDGKQSLYLVDSSGNTNSIVVGWYQTLQYWKAYNLRSAPNNACTYVEFHNDWGAPDHREYSLISVNNLNTTKVATWIWNMGVGDVLSDAIANYHNSYYCCVNNFWIDLSTGDTLDFSSLRKIFLNDDFLFNDTAITRKSLSGSIIWSTPADGYNVFSCTESIIYAAKDSIRKFDATNGQLIWTKPKLYSGNLISNIGNDDLIFVAGRNLTILDSATNLIEQITNNFTHYNPSILSTTSDGSIITGGSFVSGRHYDSQKGYSPLLIKLNQKGHGTIDSTTYYYSGDADFDGYEEFADDAVVIAAALGKSNWQPNINQWLSCQSITYSPDWIDSFPSGLNYKYSDLDFDGVITPNDISKLGNGQLPYIYAKHNNPAGEILNLLTDNYSPNIGDTFNVAVTMGTQLNPVDTIYGISCVIPASVGNTAYFLWDFKIKNGSIGDTAINLFYQTSPHSNGIVICRTDQLNTTVSGDTIFTAKAAINWMCCWSPHMMGVVARGLTKDGYTVPFNVIPITFGPTTLTENIYINDKERIYPNPVDNILHCEGFEQIKNVRIINTLGETVFYKKVQENEIPTSNFSPGIYFIRIETENNIITRNFSVQH